MVKRTQLTTNQRAERLIDLIKDGKSMGFNKKLIAGFKEQLAGLQAELESDKEDIKKFKSNLLREQELKKVRDTKPLTPQLNAITTS